MAANESRLAVARELEVFAESSWLVASTLDLGEVLERLADVAQTRLGVDIVRIWLAGDRAGTLTLRTETGTSGQDDANPSASDRDVSADDEPDHEDSARAASIRSAQDGSERVASDRG